MKRVALCVPFALCCLTVPATAQKAVRDSAFKLFDLGKNREAQAMLERLVTDSTTDIRGHETLGMTLLRLMGTLPDAEARRLQRVRARSEFEKAMQLGTKNDQVIALFKSIPADGGADASFSDNAEVEAAMQKAEKAYSEGDLRLAFTFYQRALALDPSLYNAALFSGDTYVKSPNVDSAYVWYERATKINPNRETAWRYWGNVLLKNGKIEEARDKVIEAMIAEPYNQLSRSVLADWAAKSKTPIGFPRLDLVAGTAAAPSTPARVAYDSVRRIWKGDNGQGGAPFKAAYPGESKYRHSVAEEKAALRAAHRVNPGNAGTLVVQKMDDAGVLEAFILIAGADEGIAEEYLNYRRDFREALKTFWTSFVFGAPYSK